MKSFDSLLVASCIVYITCSHHQGCQLWTLGCFHKVSLRVDHTYPPRGSLKHALNCNNYVFANESKKMQSTLLYMHPLIVFNGQNLISRI